MTVELSESARLLLDEQMARGGHDSPSEMEAGETIPAEQVFDEVNAKHGWSE